jgi:TolA-binding protein
MTVIHNKKVLMASLALAIGFSVPAAAQQGELNVTADLVIQVQELQDEVRTLRGRLEEQDREIENLKRRQRDQYLDLDQRISDLRNGQPALSSGAGAATASSAAAMGTAAGSSVSAGADVPDVRAPMETESAVT